MSSSKPLFFKAIFFVILILAISSCNKKKNPENKNNKYVLTKDPEEIEAYFFVATSKTTKSIISKSQLVQQKSLQTSVKDISIQIENSQNKLLQEINKIAVQKLIIINEINATVTNKDVYELKSQKNTDFDKAYLNSVSKSLSETIRLFESIANETNDTVILKLVTHYLPKQYEILRQTEKIKKTIN
ncbi:DUF4142 domain-containing protein [Flavobacterium limi]|uniref:DUF4142 domain-containing protein n=1 Tax=Flavobacterium limi TaxID=2045105 RepID=A0ABQ1TUP6_9FLAO|nr:DUF4142 domain-containing protein [Flavobacterium limi]GGF04198.1 hypothetical protein GCM10011518_11760 [Flavobacterium limi]